MSRRTTEASTPAMRSGVASLSDVHVSRTSPPISHNTPVKNKSAHNYHSNTKPKYWRSHQAKHVVFDLRHVERRVKILENPTDEITLQLPPNLSLTQRNTNQKYLISLTVVSDEQGKLKKASVTKVEDGDCCGKKSTGLCSVCWEKPCDLIFLPCGHLTTCHGCGVKWYMTSRKCPLCRGEIADIYDVFFSGDNVVAEKH
jgi:hypothetical protein